MSASPARQHIQLRGVRVHNLKNIDLDIPLGKITAISGLSGSGKSSLAFDTLYAEGQRRYIESFSAYARRFLDRLDKPDADRIDNLPPAIALRQNEVGRRQRETIAAVTEIDSYLRLLFARLGRIVCPSCEQLVARATPPSIVAELATIRACETLSRDRQGAVVSSCESPLPDGRGSNNSEPLTDGARLMLGFRLEPASDVTALLRLGFNRAIVLPSDDQAAAEMIALSDVAADAISARRVLVVTDRVVAGRSSTERLTESIEVALREGGGRCVVLVETAEEAPPRSLRIGDRSFALRSFSTHLECADCSLEFQTPQPQLFSPRSPLGACPSCHGERRDIAVSVEKLVPDDSKSLASDAFALWADPRWKHE